VIMTGGHWDRKRKNLYFLACAGLNDGIPAVQCHDCLLFAIDQLGTAAVLMQLDKWVSAGNQILIDSGVFALT
jgi:hypothetical protein